MPYKVTNVTKVRRVIHDAKGKQIALEPGKSVDNINLPDRYANRLMARNDALKVEPSKSNGGGERVMIHEELTRETLADMGESGAISYSDFRAKSKMFLGDNPPKAKSALIDALRGKESQPAAE